MSEVVDTAPQSTVPDTAVQVQQAQPTYEPAAPDTVEGSGYVFPETGNAGLDFALGKAASWGITQESPAFQAAIQGDFSLLEMELAANPDAHGHAQLVAFAKQMFQQEVDAQIQAEEQREAAVQEAVYGQAGGEEAYQEVADWIRGNADDSERAVFNDLLGRGDPAYGVIAYLAMQQLYNANAQKPASDPIQPTANVQTGGSGSLSVQEYQAEYINLIKTMGKERALASPQLAHLRARVRN